MNQFVYSRYGPPPSYPNLKIPGLNAPIPEGCSFGYHAGGWGKPPVDEKGKPLYGDVFGTSSLDADVSDFRLIHFFFSIAIESMTLKTKLFGIISERC